MAGKPTSTATYDDVNLLLRLYDLRREDRLRAARQWFVANFRASNLEEFSKLCPPGSEENTSFRMVISYWDMVASFITAGVLNAELFFESNRELLMVYLRSEPLLAPAREMFKDPLAWRNLELVGIQYRQWLESRAPGSVDAFIARVVSPPR